MELLKGGPVSSAIGKEIKECLKGREGRQPVLAVIRVGEREDDLSYERSARKKLENLGIGFRSIALPSDISMEELSRRVKETADDPEVDGIMLFRPLPRHLDEQAIIRLIPEEKDVDGVTPGSLAGVFTDRKGAFAPCTAEACVRLLKFYDIPLSGKRAVVAGRSLVVGKPLSMLLLRENATVTICHSRTKDLAKVCREGDILVAAVGRPEMFGAEHIADQAVVLDVGIHVKEDGSLCGDVNAASAGEKDVALTPVPGGIGAVTTAVLARHVLIAAGILKE